MHTITFLLGQIMLTISGRSAFMFLPAPPPLVRSAIRDERMLLQSLLLVMCMVFTLCDALTYCMVVQPCKLQVKPIHHAAHKRRPSQAANFASVSSPGGMIHFLSVSSAGGGQARRRGSTYGSDGAHA